MQEQRQEQPRHQESVTPARVDVQEKKSPDLHLNKKSILRKTAQVGALTFLSRSFAILREMLQVHFFGVGVISDAFIIAFRLPNLFRHVFAEGALSASFVPAIVKTIKEGKRQDANGVMTLSFMFFQGVILLMYLGVLFKADLVVKAIAPGFSGEQAEYTVLFLKILFPFLFLVSGSALLAGALQSVNHFFVPAFGPALWNMVYVSTLALCITFKWTPMALCYGVVFAGSLQLLLHMVMYFRLNFSFGKITTNSKAIFKNIMQKFLPCLYGVSIVEVNLFISAVVASFLPKGSVTLLYYSSRFMNIPLGVFAVAFASILLPHFSRIVLYAPKRMNFYVLETVKFVTWAIVPAVIFLMINAHKIFEAFLMKKGTLAQIGQARWILMIYCTGLLCFCLNKILLNMFYALKDTKTTTYIAGMGSLVNIIGDVVGMWLWGSYGIAAAAAFSGFVMTGLCFGLLSRQHNVTFYLRNYAVFLARYATQLLAIGVFLIASVMLLAQTSLQPFMLTAVGYWVMAFMLAGLGMGLLFVTRDLFRVNIYFLRK